MAWSLCAPPLPSADAVRGTALEDSVSRRGGEAVPAPGTCGYVTAGRHLGAGWSTTKVVFDASCDEGFGPVGQTPMGTSTARRRHPMSVTMANHQQSCEMRRVARGRDFPITFQSKAGPQTPRRVADCPARLKAAWAHRQDSESLKGRRFHQTVAVPGSRAK